MTDPRDLSREELLDIVKGIKFDTNMIEQFFAGWCPFPDRAYAELVGWPVNEDGTITTPGLGRVPSRELCEVQDLEELYQREGDK